MVSLSVGGCGAERDQGRERLNIQISTKDFLVIINYWILVHVVFRTTKQQFTL